MHKEKTSEFPEVFFVKGCQLRRSGPKDNTGRNRAKLVDEWYYSTDYDHSLLGKQWSVRASLESSYIYMYTWNDFLKEGI